MDAPTSSAQSGSVTEQNAATSAPQQPQQTATTSSATTTSTTATTTTGQPPTQQLQPFPSLYIGDLHPAVTDQIVEQHFAKALPPFAIRSVHVCRDKETQKSLGYGYINFETHADAEKILTTMNYTKICDVQCRLMWMRRDPSLRRSGQGNVFIQNLPEAYTSQQLYAVFSPIGPILSCKVHAKKGHGFVHFKEVADAQTAIEKWNNKNLGGNDILVMPFVRRSEALGAQKDSIFTNLYVKNLDPSIDTSKLQQLFERYGPVTSCLVAADKTGKSKGFGFVNFQNHEDAKKAVELNQKVIQGISIGEEPLYVARHQVRTERSSELRRQWEATSSGPISTKPGTNIYVRNLVDSVNDEVLAQYFSSVGNVLSATVMRDSQGISKGFGFVKFALAEEGQRAVHLLNGQQFRGKPLYVAIHQRREQRRLQLEAAYSHQRMMMPPLGMYQPLWGYPLPAMPRGVPGMPMYPPFPGWLPPAMRPQNFGRPPVQMQMPFMQPQPYPSNGRRVQQQVPPTQHARSGQPQIIRSSAESWAGKAAVKTPTQQGRMIPGLNQPMPNVMQQQMQAQQPQQAPLAENDPEKQEVGEKLYNIVKDSTGALAGRVTGMMLQSIGVPVLRQLLNDENTEALQKQISEAYNVLQDHLSKAPSNN
ncbi:polyadenylate-binding protein 1 [Pelomyxa schiedti]|nr:polyadenylate-binding protein 1 [Pelomyxa schiedti]